MNRALLIFFLPPAATGSGRTAADEAPIGSLAEWFKPGVVFQDRNGDGVVDFVNAQVVLPENPSAVEIAAASDVAARLGFETSAMDLPLVRLNPGTTGAKARTTPTVFVGARS